MRVPSAGFAILWNDDLAELFAIRSLLQMNGASVWEASKRQQGWDAIASWTRGPVQPCVCSPLHEKFMLRAGSCGRREGISSALS